MNAIGRRAYGPLGSRVWDPIVRRLRAEATISEADQAVIRSSICNREVHDAGQPLGRTESSGARFVVSGWACRRRTLGDGRSQIFDFVLPGELVAPEVFEARPAPSELMAVTGVETVEVSGLTRYAVDGGSPTLSAAVARLQHQAATRVLDHVVRLGQLSAYERMAHFLLDLCQRLLAAGLHDGGRFPMPLKQEMISHSLGLSIVHVNRTLMQLRRDGLIILKSGTMSLHDAPGLAQVCGYDFRLENPVAESSLRAADGVYGYGGSADDGRMAGLGA